MVMQCNITSAPQDVEVKWEALWKLPVQLVVTSKALCSSAGEGSLLLCTIVSIQLGASCTEFIKSKSPRMAVEAGPEVTQCTAALRESAYPALRNLPGKFPGSFPGIFYCSTLGQRTHLSEQWHLICFCVKENYGGFKSGQRSILRAANLVCVPLILTQPVQQHEQQIKSPPTAQPKLSSGARAVSLDIQLQLQHLQQHIRSSIYYFYFSLHPVGRQTVSHSRTHVSTLSRAAWHR